MKPVQITDGNGVTHCYVNDVEKMTFHGEISGERDVMFFVSGEITEDTVLNFVNELNMFIDGGARLTLDLSRLVYINSRAQGELADMQQRVETNGKGGSFRIINVPEAIMARFDASGYSDYLDIQ